MKRRDFVAGLLANITATAARAAEPSKIYRIAYVTPSSPRKALLSELSRLGYVEGNNLLVLPFAANGDSTRFDSLVRDAMNAKPDLIFAFSSRLALRFKAATTTIPVVATMSDPVAFGIVPSIAHPGGNITGVSSDAGLEVWGKRLAMLVEAAPNASHGVGFLVSDTVLEITKAGLPAAAHQLSIPVVGSPLRAVLDESEYRRVFRTMQQAGAQGLVVSEQPEHFVRQRLIVELAEQYRLPTIYPSREFVEAGGLMAYAYDFKDMLRRMAEYGALIFKGKKPGDLPIYQADKFTMINNIRAAKMLGLTIPAMLLARADEVIE